MPTNWRYVYCDVRITEHTRQARREAARLNKERQRRLALDPRQTEWRMIPEGTLTVEGGDVAKKQKDMDISEKERYTRRRRMRKALRKGGQA